MDWQRIGHWAVLTSVGVLAAVNLVADAAKVAQVANVGLVAAINTRGSDWLLMSEASRVTLAGGNPYLGTTFMWTPLGALAFYPAYIIGWHLWQLAHVGGALAMPSWRMRVLVLLAYPFWNDVELGNILVFVLLAAAWALRGNRVGIGAFLLLTVLVPRPLMAPVAVWLLWKHPQWRLALLAVVLSAVAFTVGIGLFGPFVARSLEAGRVMTLGNNYAPWHAVGEFWLVVAIPLAAWFTWRGRLGLASIIASPYWLPYYLMLPLLEADHHRAGV